MHISVKKVVLYHPVYFPVHQDALEDVCMIGRELEQLMLSYMCDCFFFSLIPFEKAGSQGQGSFTHSH